MFSVSSDHARSFSRCLRIVYRRHVSHAVAIAWLVWTSGAAYLAHRRGLPRHPDTQPARTLARVETVMLGAATFAAIRLVIIALYLVLTRDA